MSQNSALAESTSFFVFNRYDFCARVVGGLDSLSCYPYPAPAPLPVSILVLQESAEDKRNRLLSELGDDTKVQKKKGWYGLF